MARCGSRSLSAITITLFLATGCGGEDDDTTPGSPLAGDVSGSFSGRAFKPGYGVALERPNTAIEIELSAAKISCARNGLIDEHLNGLFAHIQVPSLEPGTYRGSVVEFSERSPNSETIAGAAAATLTTDAATPEAISGSVSFAELGNTLEGAFRVLRCEP